MSNVVASTQSVSKDVREQFVQDFGRLMAQNIGGAGCVTTGKYNQKCLEENDIKKSDRFNDCMVFARTCLANKNRAYNDKLLQYSKK